MIQPTKFGEHTFTSDQVFLLLFRHSATNSVAQDEHLAPPRHHLLCAIVMTLHANYVYIGINGPEEKWVQLPFKQKTILAGMDAIGLIPWRKNREQLAHRVSPVPGRDSFQLCDSTPLHLIPNA